MLIRVQLPAHLQVLADVPREVSLDVPPPATQRSLIDALERQYPTLKGCTREGSTQRRRPLVRFLACGEDLSHEPPDAPLPDPVCVGAEPFVILGAIAGG